MRCSSSVLSDLSMSTAVIGVTRMMIHLFILFAGAVVAEAFVSTYREPRGLFEVCLLDAEDINCVFSYRFL